MMYAAHLPLSFILSWAAFFGALSARFGSTLPSVRNPPPAIIPAYFTANKISLWFVLILGVAIALHVIYKDRFERGPFHLGRSSYPITIITLLRIAFILGIFCLPQFYQVNAQIFNYAPIAVGAVLTFALGSCVSLPRAAGFTGARSVTVVGPSHHTRCLSPCLSVCCIAAC